MPTILDAERIVGGTDLTVDTPAGTVRFQECAEGEWLTKKGEPARKAHRGYWLDGEPIAAVSDITATLAKPALDHWKQKHMAIGAVQAERLGELHGVPEEDYAARVTMLGLGPDAARAEGAARGTAIHAVMHAYVTTGEPPNPAELPQECRPWLSGAMRACLALDPEVIAAEFMVCHPELRYAGRPDLYAICGGLRTLIDYKTGRGIIHDGAHWQTRGYAECFEHCGLEPPERILIVGINDEGGFTLADCDVSPEEWRALVCVFQSTRRRRR